MQKTKSSRPSYSLRALAKKLKVSPGALSEFLRGKRKLSPEVAVRVIESLSLPDDKRESLLGMIHKSEDTNKALTAEEFMTVAHWSAAALMCLFEFETPPDSLEEIAKKIGIPQEKIREKIESLKSLGLLRETPENEIKSQGLTVSTTQDIPSEAIQKFHHDSLSLSQAALLNLPATKREFTSVTFSSTKDKLELGKKEIRKFREFFSSKLATPVRDEVYHLQICFYPLTDWEKSSKVEK
ncbi:MAG: TIGR02147 family protein [Bdellovibrionaceae bacterium]|nr:TIGR02147 family protein [Pseudobdellovibrionaceae bacterium]